MSTRSLITSCLNHPHFNRSALSIALGTAISTTLCTTLSGLLLANTASAQNPMASAPAPKATPVTAIAASKTDAPALDLSSLSKTTRACDDFYAYANENWLKTATIPADRAYWGAFAEIQQRNEETLKTAMRALKDDGSKIKSDGIRKAVDYYRSGLDTSTIETRGLEPLAPIFAKIETIKNGNDLAIVIADLHRKGINPWFNAGIDTNAKDRTRYWVGLSQGGLGLPERDYYLRNDAKSKDIRTAYLAHVEKMLTLSGTPATQAKQDAKAILALETGLAKASMTNVEMRDPKATYNNRSFAQLRSVAASFDWETYFKESKLPQPTEMNISTLKFIPAMAKLAKSTPLTTTKAYLRWNVLRASAARLPAKFEEENFAFFGAKLNGRKAQRPREERVLQDIGGRYGDAALGEALGQVFVERSFSPAAKERAVSMVGYINEALAQRIKELTWMSESTKKAALLKLEKMVLKVGYPDKWKDYTGLAIKSDAYLQNWLASNEFQSDYWVAKLGKPVDHTEWFMAPHIVNAYAGDFNEIVFPAGILQPPFFNEKADEAVNFGAIGMVIGHEITHHFDDNGRQFNELGNLKDWWTKEDAARYSERAQALVKQYNGYVGANNTNVNGKLTLGENIADLGGLTIAHLGLKKYLTKTPQSDIDGFTAEQRYFLSYAQSWKELSRPESELQLLLTDSHSPPRFRVKGPLANMPAFATTFNCKLGDLALRGEADRVTIW